MVKVEAVVIRERAETVIDAVEGEAGHVGVTVVEAVGHGRQRGITHEYRGRIWNEPPQPRSDLLHPRARRCRAGPPNSHPTRLSHTTRPTPALDPPAPSM